MSNIYHILHKDPALDATSMPAKLEALAQKLVASGRLRIDTIDKINFVRYPIPDMGVTLMISHLEIHDEQLRLRTRAILKSILGRKHSGKALGNEIKKAFHYLIHKDKQNQAVPPLLEKKLARVIVQSTEPEVIQLLLLEGTEVFISYDYMVGDMLDIVSWQQVGSSSGLQSTDGRMSAVFVSTGGAPFKKLPKAEQNEVFGDGKPALARMMVIGAQELGHYADIIRDGIGHKIARHSAHISGYRAHPRVAKARLNDIAHINQIEATWQDFDFHTAVQLDRAIKFYRKHRKRGFAIASASLRAMRRRNVFFSKARKSKHHFTRAFTSMDLPALTLHMAVKDMLFNLSPQAEAYRRDNPQEEEAIACIEALARIPQQVVKWGHETTKALMPHLYAIYYKEVIPACRKAVKQLNKKAVS